MRSLQSCSCFAFALVAGCASSRIALGLEHYGLDHGRATCVGDRLAANLSIGQLQQLGRAANALPPGAAPGSLTIGDFMTAAGQIHDPTIPFEVAKASAGCGVLKQTSASPL